MSEFKKGDEVQLKSGGPEMVIQCIDAFSALNNETGAECVWFDDRNQLQKMVFALDVLKPYVSPTYRSVRVTRA